METPFHRLAHVFRQLGLADDHEGIEDFLATHRPLPPGVLLHEADFWNASQASFLRDAVADDADWAERVDELSERLRA